MKNILFIGAGNMAFAIYKGIINAGTVKNENILLFDKNIEQYSKFDANCKKLDNINESISLADYVFISVKPQNVSDVLALVDKDALFGKVFVTICAGVTIKSIEDKLGNVKIIRAMPNTPLLIGQGVTALCKNRYVEDTEYSFVKSLFASSGIVTDIKEDDINGVTAITSSSPAYVYTFIKSMLDGAKSLDFNYDNTINLICQTIIGSVNMVLGSSLTIEQQINMVKSPNGTTEKALNVLDSKDFSGAVVEAMIACKKRAEELSKLN